MLDKYRQRGFAAISAIFLIVAVGAMGAVMLTVSKTQQLTFVQDLQGTRAYWAAQGGLEWLITGVAASAPVAPASTPAAICPVGAPPEQLDGFVVTMSCSKRTYDEAGASIHIFSLTSVASTANSAPGNLGFIERSVSAKVER